jgi:hypothetical protein
MNGPGPNGVSNGVSAVGPTDDRSGADDPVLARRRRIFELSVLGKRIGYSIIGLACVVFVWGLVFGVRGWMVTFTACAFGLAAMILCPAIIAGYGVDAANKDEGRPTFRPYRH